MSSQGSEGSPGSPVWGTWVAFAAVMLMLIGVFTVIAGLAAAFEDDYFVRAPFEGKLFVVSTQVLGIIWIVLGVVKVMTGYALIQGRSWARILGIIFVFLNAVSAMAALGQQPFISVLLIALDVTILYGLTGRWEAAKVGMGD